MVWLIYDKRKNQAELSSLPLYVNHEPKLSAPRATLGRHRQAMSSRSSSRQISWSAVQTTMRKTSLPTPGDASRDTWCTGPEWCCKWSNKLAWPKQQCWWLCIKSIYESIPNIYLNHSWNILMKILLSSALYKSSNLIDITRPGCCWDRIRPELRCWRPRCSGLRTLMPVWWVASWQVSSAYRHTTGNRWDLNIKKCPEICPWILKVNQMLWRSKVPVTKLRRAALNLDELKQLYTEIT